MTNWPNLSVLASGCCSFLPWLLFLSSSRFNRKLPELYRAVGPFLLLLLTMLALVTYLPQISLTK